MTNEDEFDLMPPRTARALRWVGVILIGLGGGILAAVLFVNTLGIELGANP